MSLRRDRRRPTTGLFVDDGPALMRLFLEATG